MKEFETQNVVSDSVDNWTIQQCEEHLKQYPKGFKADQARVRLKKLQQPVAPKKEETKPASNEGKLPSTNVFNGMQVGQTTSSSKSSYKQSDDSALTFLKVLATIVCVVIMITGVVLIFTVNPAFMAVLPLFYFPLQWMNKMWDWHLF